MRQSDLRPARSEPLDLLKLNPVPWRIADNGVEPAVPARARPVVPDTRKTDLPVEETFFPDQRARFLPDFGETFDLGRLCRPLLRDLAPACDWNGFAEPPIDPEAKQRLVILGFEVQPIQCLNKADKTVELSRHQLNVFIHRG